MNRETIKHKLLPIVTHAVSSYVEELEESVFEGYHVGEELGQFKQSLETLKSVVDNTLLETYRSCVKEYTESAGYRDPDYICLRYINSILSQVFIEHVEESLQYDLEQILYFVNVRLKNEYGLTKYHPFAIDHCRDEDAQFVMTQIIHVPFENFDEDEQDMFQDMLRLEKEYLDQRFLIAKRCLTRLLVDEQSEIKDDIAFVVERIDGLWV